VGGGTTRGIKTNKKTQAIQKAKKKEKKNHLAVKRREISEVGQQSVDRKKRGGGKGRDRTPNAQGKNGPMNFRDLRSHV